jgi:hypothetical protein
MRVHPNIVKNWSCHLNALAHSTFSVAPFLISKCITVMPQPPYSPDLAPCKSFLFQKVTSAVKGHHFEFTEDNHRNVTQVLNDTPQGVCYNGSTAGKGACRHKGCTLKVTTLQLLNKLNKNFLKPVSYFIVRPCSIIIPSFTVLYYVLAKLVGPASWRMLDPYIKNINVEITPCQQTSQHLDKVAVPW